MAHETLWEENKENKKDLIHLSMGGKKRQMHVLLEECQSKGKVFCCKNIKSQKLQTWKQPKSFLAVFLSCNSKSDDSAVRTSIKSSTAIFPCDFYDTH